MSTKIKGQPVSQLIRKQKAKKLVGSSLLGEEAHHAWLLLGIWNLKAGEAATEVGLGGETGQVKSRSEIAGRGLLLRKKRKEKGGGRIGDKIGGWAVGPMNR